MMGKRIINAIAIILSFFLATSVFAESVSDNHKDIFEERLSKYFNDLKAISETSTSNSKEVETAMKSGNELLKFADEYPNSRYADDAQYIVLYLSSAEKINLSKWEAFYSRFPNGRLEDSTIEFLKNTPLNSPLSLSELHLPYNLLLLNIKSMDALINKNYDDVVKYSYELIGKIDNNNEDLKEITAFNYIKLLVSYKYLSRREDYEKLKEKAIVLFPDKKEKFEGVWK